MTLRYENQKVREGFKYIIGCDEVGRGCLAGPVVAASVILDLKSGIKDLKGVRDSKMLSPKQRKELEPIIKAGCLAWSIGEVSSKVVDKINIHNATLLAMKKAVDSLFVPSSDLIRGSMDSRLRGNDKLFLYVDGKFSVPQIGLAQEAVVGGDNKILSVAAASIIAKVYRDELMVEYHKNYPIYNFAQHKGYATFHHRQMVIKYGLSDIHRRSFCRNLVI